MVLTGSLLGVAGAGLCFALLLAGFWMPLALFGPIMAVGLGNGFAVPNAQAGAVSVQPLLAGTASGIAGLSQMFVAALVSQAVGMLQNGALPDGGVHGRLRRALAARLRPAATLGPQDR